MLKRNPYNLKSTYFKYRFYFQFYNRIKKKKSVPNDEPLLAKTDHFFTIVGTCITVIFAIITIILMIQLDKTDRKVKILEDILITSDTTNRNLNNLISEMKKIQNQNDSAYKVFSQTLHIQLSNLIQNQKQFEINNEPYLHIKTCIIDTFKYGKPIQGVMEIENFGRYPCKVLDSKTFILTKVSPPTPNELIDEFPDKFDIINEYIYFNKSLIKPLTTNEVLNFNKEYNVKYYDWYVYLWGNIKYVNLITNKIKIYTFLLKMKPGYTPLYLINENKEFTK